jgi:DNA-binding LacI/PurR family transcriptional regulator
MQKITLQDIASRLNLSLSSVGRALSDRGGNTRISEATRLRIREMARHLNYRSNSSARSLSVSRFNNIGYCTVKKATDDYAFHETILQGLSDVAAEHGQNLIMVQLPSGPDRFSEIPRALREQCLDALVINDNANFLPGFQDAIADSGLPVAYLNEKQAFNAIYVDEMLSGRMMTQHLIARGFRRITMLSLVTKRPHYSAADRVAGYVQAMEEAGLQPENRSFHNKTLTEEAGPWLSSPARPEAIFCYSDILAMSLLRALYALRVRVPDDIAVAGCDGEEQALRSVVPLTTLQIPFRPMAAHVLRMALDLVNDPERKPIPSIVLTPELVVAASTERSGPQAGMPFSVPLDTTSPDDAPGSVPRS